MAFGRESRSSFLPILLWVGLSVFAAPARVRPYDAEGSGEFLARGELALRRGDLAGAEKAFRQALAADPKSVAAYANLGVVYMRRQQWPQALIMLQEAEGEFEIAGRMQKETRDELEREVSGERMPRPELATEPK